jgi:hypothetical protein
MKSAVEGHERLFRNKQFNLIHTSLFHFIEVHTLDMFRALLAHPQEALHKRRVGDCAGAGLRMWEDCRLPTS